MSFARTSTGAYICTGVRVLGLVILDGEIWRSRVTVDGQTVDMGEWDGRQVAIGNAKTAMSRACWLRRFDDKPPAMPDDEDYDDDEDDDED